MYIIAMLYVAASLLLLAQAPLAFDAASIRPGMFQPRDDIDVATNISLGPRHVRLTGVSIQDCLALAYGLEPGRISGPEWLNSTRFDIAAVLPDGATRRDVPALLQALLTSRFGLRAHREPREMPVYSLEVASGTLLLETANADPEAADDPSVVAVSGTTKGLQVQLPRGGSYALWPDRFEARKVTLAMLADALSRVADRPVVDSTGVEGHFNIAFDITPGEYRSMLIRYGTAAGLPIPFDAGQWASAMPIPSAVAALKRAGLALEQRRLPIDVLVVDDIRRVPTEN